MLSNTKVLVLGHNMKKIIFLLIFMTALSGYAQDIEYTNQVTVAWDVVAPIEPTDIITYQVWTDSVAGIVMVGKTDLVQYTITFTVEGEYIIGVGTKREVVSGDIVYSEINWSNVNGVSTPDPFVVRYIKPIQSPENLRLP